MISTEEQHILDSLAEFSRDIKSHLILIEELAAQTVGQDTRACRLPSQVASKRA